MGEESLTVRRRCVGVFVALSFAVALAGLFLVMVRGAESYSGYGFLGLIGGLGFAFAGMAVWRLFYAFEDEGQAGETSLQALSRAWHHQWQQRAGELSVFPDKAVLVWTVFGALQVILFCFLSALAGVQEVVWLLVVGVMAGLCFFAAQTAVQMVGETGKRFLSGVLLAVFLVPAIWQAFVSFEGMDMFDVRHVVLLAIACLALIVRFGRAVLVRPDAGRLYGVTGLVVTVIFAAVLLVRFMAGEAIAFGFVWSGCAVLGALSGLLYRQREKRYSLY